MGKQETHHSLLQLQASFCFESKRTPLRGWFSVTKRNRAPHPVSLPLFCLGNKYFRPSWYLLPMAIASLHLGYDLIQTLVQGGLLSEWNLQPGGKSRCPAPSPQAPSGCSVWKEKEEEENSSPSGGEFFLLWVMSFPLKHSTQGRDSIWGLFVPSEGSIKQR